ncbi:hypothetical protein PG994_001414 [Apiospora phragmitis]|uniref:Uncharacterized protein n=1 Tax=Apiospora phragmitis TaxID=2905665 RepID=A0ABR1WTF0_9PEZI
MSRGRVFARRHVLPPYKEKGLSGSTALRSEITIGRSYCCGSYAVKPAKSPPVEAATAKAATAKAATAKATTATATTATAATAKIPKTCPATVANHTGPGVTLNRPEQERYRRRIRARWAHVCRKHYQSSRYRNAQERAKIQCELVQKQIQRVQSWSDDNKRADKQAKSSLHTKAKELTDKEIEEYTASYEILSNKWLIVTDLPKPSTPIATIFKGDSIDQQKTESSKVNTTIQWVEDQLYVPSFRIITTYSRGEAKAAVFVQASTLQERDEIRRQARYETIYNAVMEEAKMLLWMTQLPGNKAAIAASPSALDCDDGDEGSDDEKPDSTMGDAGDESVFNGRFVIGGHSGLL